MGWGGGLLEGLGVDGVGWGVVRGTGGGWGGVGGC